MRTIHKVPIELSEKQGVRVPNGAKFLTVQVQRGQPCLWYMCDSTYTPKMRIIRVYGTGHEMPTDRLSYIGTFQLENGAFVFHVFEESPA